MRGVPQHADSFFVRSSGWQAVRDDDDNDDQQRTRKQATADYHFEARDELAITDSGDDGETQQYERLGYRSRR